jgi:photosystem II stability/assembly factor-like uncharacterized protein
MRVIHLSSLTFIYWGFIVITIQAQWIQTNGPTIGDVRCLEVIGSYVFAGTYEGGVFRTEDCGNNWVPSNSGLSNPVDMDVFSIIVVMNNLFIGTGGGVFLSTDLGMNWTPRNGGLTHTPIEALVTQETYLFAATFSGGIFRSTDNGVSWAPCNNGVSNLYPWALFSNGTTLLAGYFGGDVYRSTNNGDSWTPANSGINCTWVNSFGSIGSLVFALTDSGAFRSIDDGMNWTKINQGLTDTYLFSLAVVGNDLFAGASGNIFMSSDSGTFWQSISSGFTSSNAVMSLKADSTYLYAGLMDGDCVWRRPLSEIITAIEFYRSYVPSSTVLEQNFPNPFNAGTKIRFYTAKRGFVILKVYDLLGREVATLVNEERPAGVHEVELLSTVDTQQLASGVYFCQLKADERIDIKKMVLQK